MSKAENDGQTRLCQNQVENLIKAMEARQSEASQSEASQSEASQSEASQSEASQSAAGQLQAHGSHQATGPHTEVDADPELLAAVRRLHEPAAIELRQSLTAMLRTDVDITVNDVTAGVFDVIEFQDNDQRWRSLLCPEFSEGDWIFDLTPRLCGVIVDRMLGGDPDEEETFQRVMTEIERGLLARVVDHILQTLQETWQTLGPLRWIARHLETSANPKLTASPLVSVRWNVTLCRHVGLMRLFVPLATIERFADPIRDRCSPHVLGGNKMSGNVAGAPVDVVTTVARSTIRTGDLLDLRVGDVIATEKHTDEPLELTIHDVPKFWVRPGALKGRKAIQIERVIDR